jgi:hypothetical protein
MPAACRAPRRAATRARTDARGAIGREALDATTGASGAAIKPGEPGERSTAKREALDAGDVPLDAPCRRARTDARGD